MTRYMLRGCVVLLLALLGGCTSNCNILSSNQSAGCDLALGAGMILAAPIAVPFALASDAADNAKAKRMAREWQENMQASLAEGDTDAARECLKKCMNAWQYRTEYADRQILVLQAAEIQLASPVENTPDHRAYTAMAHYFLSLPRRGEAEDTRRRADTKRVGVAYELMKDDDTRKRMYDLLTSSEYNNILRNTYARVHMTGMSPDAATARTRYQRCPLEISKVFLEDHGESYPFWSCANSYYYYFGEQASDSQMEAWRTLLKEARQKQI